MKKIPMKELLKVLKKIAKKQVKKCGLKRLQDSAKVHMDEQLAQNAPSQPTFYSLPSPSGSTLKTTTHYSMEEYLLSATSLYYLYYLQNGERRKKIITDLAKAYEVRIKDMKHLMDKEDLCRSRVYDMADALYGRFTESRHNRRMY